MKYFRKALYLCLSLIVFTGQFNASVDATEWSIEAPLEDIPDQQVSGVIFGREFKLGQATYNGAALEFDSEDANGLLPHAQVMVFIDLSTDQSEWYVTPATDNFPPHVHMRFNGNDPSNQGVMMFTGEYSMRLEIIEISRESITGRIHLSLPDYKFSFLVGSFNAQQKPNVPRIFK